MFCVLGRMNVFAWKSALPIPAEKLPILPLMA
jgi:hypothetical protein